jgi:hypothetical protein
MGVLKSALLINTDPADAVYDRHKVEGTRRWVRHDVDAFRVTYTTRDTDGQEVLVSGALLVPRVAGPLRVICYCRGTIIPVHGEENAPSYYRREKI